MNEEDSTAKAPARVRAAREFNLMSDKYKNIRLIRFLLKTIFSLPWRRTRWRLGGSISSLSD
jgi:hypothetical protein